MINDLNESLGDLGVLHIGDKCLIGSNAGMKHHNLFIFPLKVFFCFYSSLIPKFYLKCMINTEKLIKGIKECFEFNL
jgi:hypothetical protein